MAYDHTYEALLSPATRPVFEGAATVAPFVVDPDGLSLANAWWLINASHLAYYPEAEMAGIAAEVGLGTLEFFTGPSTQAFLTVNERFAVLAFRGTEPKSEEDIKRDLDIGLVELAADVPVHRGFLAGLDEVWPEVEARLEALDGLPVWFTGHSLGAALAVLAAARRPPRGLYTFGSPRAGGAALAALLERVPSQRFVNCTDLVARVPPPTSHYRHSGQLQFITADGVLLTDPSGWRTFMARLRGRAAYHLSTAWFLPGRVKLRSLTDHAVGNYTESIRRVLG